MYSLAVIHIEAGGGGQEETLQEMRQAVETLKVRVWAK